MSTDLIRRIKGMLLDPDDAVVVALVAAIEQLGDARDTIDEVAAGLPDIEDYKDLRQIAATLSDATYWEVDDQLEAVRDVLLRHVGKSRSDLPTPTPQRRAR